MTLAQQFGDALRCQGRIVGALMLRDMRTRFGRSQLSFLIAVAWPLSHLFVIYLSFILVSRFVPIGGSAGIFIATGAAPYILCMYPGRMLTLTMIVNAPLLMFPIVKTTDLVIARAAVECVSALLVIALFVLILLAFDVDIIPPDIPAAAAAILASIYLGIGLGFMNVVICAIFRFWLFVFIGFMLLFYVTSGVTTLQLGLSDGAKFWLWFNPVLHLVTWMRTAFYGSDYGVIPLSRAYVVGFATVCFALGFVGDRLLRGRVLLTSH